MSDAANQVEAAVVGAPSPAAAPNGADPAQVERPRDPYAPRLPAAVQRAAARADELQRAAAEAEQVTQQPPDEATRELDEAIQQPQPEDSWQSRYRTLQGKYDAEIPTLRNQITQLEHLIATMRAPPERPVAYVPAEPVPLDMSEEIPEEDLTTYGQDFVDSARRWARAEMAPAVKSLQQQVQELRGYYQQTTGDRAKDRVRAELDRDPELNGRWQHLDTDAGFNQWLSEYDQFSGNRRLDMLRDAYAGGDAVRTGRFFKAYLQEHTDTLRAPQATPQTLLPGTRPPQNGNGHSEYYAGQVDLAAYAAPGRASNATPGPGAPERRFWTNREIQAFYSDRMRGRYRGREPEADRLERDLLAAAAEGRIRNE